MPYFPIGPGLSKKLDKLEVERAKLDRAKYAARDALVTERKKLEQADRELVDGMTQDALSVAAGSSPDLDRMKAHANLAAIRSRVEELERDCLAHDRACEAKEQELRRFVADNVAALYEAHAPQAADAVTAGEDLAAELLGACQRLIGVRHRSEALQRHVAGGNTRSVPLTGVESLLDVLEALTVVSPLPAELTESEEEEEAA